MVTGFLSTSDVISVDKAAFASSCESSTDELVAPGEQGDTSLSLQAYFPLSIGSEFSDSSELDIELLNPMMVFASGINRSLQHLLEMEESSIAQQKNDDIGFDPLTGLTHKVGGAGQTPFSDSESLIDKVANVEENELAIAPIKKLSPSSEGFEIPESAPTIELATTGSTILRAEEEIFDGSTDPQIWGDGVTLSAVNLNNRPARLIFDDQFDDVGFGVAGGRYDQIDFLNGDSERIEIDFGGAVTNVVMTFGQMNPDERGRVETGKWTAYADGEQVAEGLLSPELSTLGAFEKVPGSLKAFPIALTATTPFTKVVIESTGFDHGTGDPFTKRNQEESYLTGPFEENTDFNIMELRYRRVNEVPVVDDDDDEPVIEPPVNDDDDDDEPVTAPPVKDDDEPVIEPPVNDNDDEPSDSELPPVVSRLMGMVSFTATSVLWIYNRDR